MKTPVGHEQVRLLLEADLPPVTLLLGPASIGKRTLAEYLRRAHRVHDADHLALAEPLTVAAVRAALVFAGTAPFGPFKLITGRLDGASGEALNAALKILEEPPDTVRFLLTSTSRTLPTVMSRCQVFRLGLLTSAEMYPILIAHGVSPAVARRLAQRNIGQVKPALRVVDGADDPARAVVVGLVQSLAQRDHDMFDRAMRVWDDKAMQLFWCWVHEATLGTFHIFGPDDMFGFDQSTHALGKLAEAASLAPRTRSRLALRAALEPLLLRS